MCHRKWLIVRELPPWRVAEVQGEGKIYRGTHRSALNGQRGKSRICRPAGPVKGVEICEL